MFPIAGTNEELDLGEECLKVGGVWHGELHKSTREEESSSDNQETFMQHKKHLKKTTTFDMLDLNENVQLHILKRIQLATFDFDIKKNISVFFTNTFGFLRVSFFMQGRHWLFI